MDEREIMGLVESLLFVSGEPIPISKLSKFLDMGPASTEKFMGRLIDTFNFERRGLQVIRVGDSYQLATRPEQGEYIESFFGTENKQSLSQAAMETLSIIAYRQPVTRMDIELIRGVKCDYAINLLLSRDLVKETGRMDTPGRPILYGTTDIFLKNFGLSSLDELPPLEA